TLNGDPMNNGDNVNYRFLTVMDNPTANSLITGAGFQYDGTNEIGAASQLFPSKKYMQTETECQSGANSWDDAEHLFHLMRRYLENNACAYFAWNMVLDDTGMSTWHWRQHALVTINRSTG